MIAATELGALVGRGEECLVFGAREEGDKLLFSALVWDGEDTLNEGRVPWLAQRDIAEKGALADRADV